MIAAGSSPVATITGAAPSQTLNLQIPYTASDNITIGTVTTIAAGATAYGTMTGTRPNLSLNLWIPQGAAATATISDGTVTPAKLSTGKPTWDASGNLTATSFIGPLTGAVTGNVTGNVVGNVTGNLTGTPISPTPLMYRNRLINGGFAIDQRNNGASHTVANAYGLDRWWQTFTGTPPTAQRIAGSGSSRYRYQVTGASGNTGFNIQQRIEAANIYDLAGQTVTASVDLAATGVTSIAVTLWFANSVDSFSAGMTAISGGTFTVSSSLSRYSTTYTLPASAQNGVAMTISPTAGPLTAGQTITLGNAQLEAGSVATPFEQRPIGAELALCQRYYQTAQGMFSGNVSAGGTYYCLTATPLMRSTPTIVGTNYSINQFSATVGSVGFGPSGVLEGRVANGTGAGGVFGTYYTLSSEL